MPKVNDDETSDNLKPYKFHGVDFHTEENGQAIADCPFCGKEGKFSVEIDTGKFRCFVCGTGNERGGGNAYVFIRKLWEVSYESTKDYSEFLTNRKLLSSETCVIWEIAKSFMTQDWLVPGYDASGKMNQLYRYIKTPDRYTLFPTPGLAGKFNHGLHGMGHFDKSKQEIYVCEGFGDGMTLWETLRQTKVTDDATLTLTANESASMLSDINVLATPGCLVFSSAWLPLFDNKVVCLLYDNDHERKHPKTGKMVVSGGFVGMQRAARMLLGAKNPPRQVNWLKWGERGFTEEYPTGYDVRDLINA